MDGRLRPLGIGEMLDAAIKIFTRNWRTLALCVVGLVLPVQILAVLVTASIAPESLDLTSSETGVSRDEETEFYVSQLAIGLLSFLSSSSLRSSGSQYWRRVSPMGVPGPR